MLTTTAIKRTRRVAAFATLGVLMLLSAPQPTLAADYQTQVWSGNAVPEGEHTAVAMVEFAFGGLCSGTLIHPRWVLTAAHCITDTPGQRVRISLGGTDASGPFDEVWTTRVHGVHRRWHYKSGRYDFGLLKLPGRSTIEPVELATFDDELAWQPGTEAQIVGWGAVDGMGRRMGRLRQGYTSIATDRRCDSRVQGYDIYSMLCGRTEEADACVGDSGGPLFVVAEERTIQMGVTSFGPACDTSGWAVYGFVPGGRRWINNTIEAGLAPVRTWSGLLPRRDAIDSGTKAVFDAGLLRNSDGVGLGDQRVELLRRRGYGYPWRVVDRARTNAAGLARFVDFPKRTMQYAVRHQGSTATLKSRSDAVRVRVRD